MNIVTVILLILAVIGLVWFLVLIFKNKKKSNVAKQKVNEQEEKLKSSDIKIRIWRQVSEDLVKEAGSLIATEKKDSNNNLLVINEEKKFKEDLNFATDRVYEIMNFSLDLHGIDNKAKANILDKKIKEQEEFLLRFEKEVELNAKYNYRDQEVKLRQLKVFRDSLRREKKGNYMRLSTNNVREYEFVVIDGILYPYFFGSKFQRVYPDLTLKKKIFNHENTVFKNETANMLNSSLSWLPVVILGIAIVWTMGNGLWTYNLMQDTNDISMEVNQGSMVCQETLATITKNYGGIINDYMQVKQQESQNNINNEKQSNNNNKPNSQINIDPSDIIGG